MERHPINTVKQKVVVLSGVHQLVGNIFVIKRQVGRNPELSVIQNYLKTDPLILCTQPTPPPVALNFQGSFTS